MQFFPVDFQAFGEQAIGIAQETVGSNVKSLLSSDLTPRNTISASAQSSDNETAAMNKTSFQRLLQKQQAENTSKVNEETPSNGKLGRTELLALREALANQGVSGDRLNRLNSLIESGRSISADDVRKALQGIDIDGIDTSVSFDLTASEKIQFKSLLGKLGFSDSEIKGIMDDLAAGGDIDVWNLLDAKIASLPFDETFEVSKEEISALARAFRLSDSQRTQLEGIFTPSLMVNSAKLAETLALVNTEMAARKHSDLMVQGSDIVQKTVAEVLARAKERKEIEDKSDNRQSQLANRMNTRILDKVTSEGKTLPQAAPNPAGEGKENLLSSYAEKTSNSPDEQLAGQGSKDKAGQQPGDSKGRASESGTGSRQNLATDSFTAKIVNAADTSLLNGTQPQSVNGPRAQTAGFSSQVFDQVASGVFKNVQEGVKQLTLQLEPGNLGALTLVVSVRENEVSATIRPDNPETAKLIEEQLYKVRQALESQGLKVDNLEVQSNAAERDSSQQWQGASKHNFTQQELEYRERVRLLHRLRHADSGMAHDMQNTELNTVSAAKNSQSEIYIVA